MGARSLRNAFLVLLVAACRAPADEFQGEVVAVGDGDTITVLRVAVGGRKTEVRVRLFGVDCPELGQPFGRNAKKATSGLVMRKAVRVQVVDRDRHERAVALVTLPDGKSLNEELVRLGLAWWFSRYAPRDKEPGRRLATLQDDAKKERLGLWRDEDPTPPWEWRTVHPRDR